MILRIKDIKSPGDLQRERVVLIVTDSGKTDDYILLRTSADNRMVYGGAGQFYWLNNGEVSTGDRVIVYSKKGDKKQKTLPDGKVSHFYYWGATEPLWQGNWGCVLIAARPRQQSRVGGFDHTADVEPDD